LKVKLAEKLQIDPCLISRLIWVNDKGLKVVVDDDMVQQLPEAQIMIADISELSNTDKAQEKHPRTCLRNRKRPLEGIETHKEQAATHPSKNEMIRRHEAITD